MELLVQKTEELLLSLNGQRNPGVCAVLLGSYISQAMREKQITLYEAYLLNAEQLTFLRASYIQMAWNSEVLISTLLEILNMKMLSHLFQNKAGVELWRLWGIEAYAKNAEKRPHYIANEYLSFLDADKLPLYLEKLLNMRNNKKKQFDDGPYHDELFPYEYCRYEELLLTGQVFPSENQQISSKVERLLVELSLMHED